MSEPTCTFCFGGPVCGAPAEVKRGVRCTNGCWGEGEFEFSCREHEEKFFDPPARILTCNACHAQGTLELMPILEVVS